MTNTSAIGRVRDPHLVAGEQPATLHLLGARLHAARIGAVVGLGEAEAADPFTGRQLWQIFLPLRLAAIGVDRMHHQRRLDAERRAVAGIDPLHLARDQPVGNVVRSGATIALDRRA
jgi:hypothetical protein